MIKNSWLHVLWQLLWLLHPDGMFRQPFFQWDICSGTVADVSLDDVLNDIKEAYGENYVPDSAVDEQMLSDIIGLSPDLYESYVAEMPMISTFVETFIGVKAKEGKGEEAEKALNAYRDQLVNDTMQYPMNVAKIQLPR